MKTVKILYQHLGSYWYTPKQPVAIWEDGMVDLEEKVSKISEDDWYRGVEVSHYAVSEVEIPEWLSAESWIRNHIGWRYLWNIHEDVKTWSEAWQKGLFTLQQIERLVCVELLRTTTFRSGFREWARDQLVEWLETQPEDREYTTPYNERIWRYLIQPRHERMVR